MDRLRWLSRLGAVRHILGVSDLAQKDVLSVLARASELKRGARGLPIGHGSLLVLAFFETSTRTRLGYAAAATALGATPIDFGGLRFGDAMSAPESLADGLRVASAYAAAVVLRHPDPRAVDMAREMQCPLLNGGCGDGEHPTQALIDLFALWEKLGTLDGLRIGVVGDLASSRAAHSLLRILPMFRPALVRLMAPSGRELPGAWLPTHMACIEYRQELDPSGLDVLYFAGLPQGADAHGGAAVRAAFALSMEAAKRLPAACLVLSPLPRIDEIDTRFDTDPRAGYFTQSDDGRFVRTAILEHVWSWAG